MSMADGSMPPWRKYPDDSISLRSRATLLAHNEFAIAQSALIPGVIEPDTSVSQARGARFDRMRLAVRQPSKLNHSETPTKNTKKTHRAMLTWLYRGSVLASLTMERPF